MITAGSEIILNGFAGEDTMGLAPILFYQLDTGGVIGTFVQYEGDPYLYGFKVTPAGVQPVDLVVDGPSVDNVYRFDGGLLFETDLPDTAANPDYVLYRGQGGVDILNVYDVYEDYDSNPVFLPDEVPLEERSQQSSAQLANGQRVEIYEAPDASGIGIYAQLYDGSGEADGGPILVNVATAGDQHSATIASLGSGFVVGWEDGYYDGSNAVSFRTRLFTLSHDSAIDLATRSTGASETFAGDVGDAVTNAFLFDTAAGGAVGKDRITGFGAKDFLLTTTRIFDANDDGIIGFGRNKLLDLAGPDGAGLGTVALAGLKSLEYDGEVTHDGITYYAYSRVGSTTALDALLG